MASGVTVHAECLEAFKNLKLGKESKYIIFNVNENKSEIIIDKIQFIKKEKVLELPKPGEWAIFNAVPKVSKEEEGVQAKSGGLEKSEKELYEEFVEQLPETECRWAVYDFVYKKEGGIRKKPILVCWTPDKAKIRDRMLFASSVDALRSSLQGIAAEIQATDFDEASFNTVLEKVEPFAAKAAQAAPGAQVKPPH